MPVYTLVEMPYDELQKWHAYLERRPFEWRDDLRTFNLMRTFGEKRKAGEVFPSLQALTANRVELPANMLDPSMLKRSSMFSRMLSARNGDTLEALSEGRQNGKEVA